MSGEDHGCDAVIHYLGGLETSSVACLGIRVMGPQVMSNIWIIGKPWYAPNACLTYH